MEKDGVQVYAVSPATPEEHRRLAEELQLNLNLLSDEELQFGLTFQFINIEEETITRGIVAVNPQSERMMVKTDYMFGDNVKDVLEGLKDL